MAALAHWNPQPAVPQPVFMPIRRKYGLERLHEQLQTATNGGRLNIFKVVGYGAQRLPDGHPGLYEASLLEDAPGEPDPAVVGGSFSRRSSSYSVVSGALPGVVAQQQRRPSVSSRA
jgi:SAGA-associated factor 73